MRYENFGPVAHPDGTPTDLTREMLAGTGRSPEDFAASVAVCATLDCTTTSLTPGSSYCDDCNGLTPSPAWSAGDGWWEEDDDIGVDLHDDECVANCPIGPDEKCMIMHSCRTCSLDADPTPTCDICGEAWEDGGEGEDWNGETGNHASCEEEPESTEYVIPVAFTVSAVSERAAVVDLVQRLASARLIVGGPDPRIESWHTPNHSWADGSDDEGVRLQWVQLTTPDEEPADLPSLQDVTAIDLLALETEAYL